MPRGTSGVLLCRWASWRFGSRDRRTSTRRADAAHGPASTSSPRTTVSPCATPCPTSASTTPPTANTTGTAATPTTPPTTAWRARPTAWQYWRHGPVTSERWPQHCCCPRVHRCCWPATSWATPRAGTTTPTAHRSTPPRRGRWTGLVPICSCWSSSVGWWRCAATPRRCASPSSSRAATPCPASPTWRGSAPTGASSPTPTGTTRRDAPCRCGWTARTCARTTATGTRCAIATGCWCCTRVPTPRSPSRTWERWNWCWTPEPRPAPPPTHGPTAGVPRCLCPAARCGRCALVRESWRPTANSHAQAVRPNSPGPDSSG